MSQTISLCMIVKNEENHLARCLESVRHTVDEIIIVDTGSTDRTVEIAERFGACISHFDWIGDFSAARNAAIEQATSDYVLVLDADEYFEERVDLKQEITTQMDYYLVRFRNLLDGVVLYHHAIRLFKNHRGFKYFGRIHEHLNVEEFADVNSEMIKPILTHVGYTQSMYNEKEKHQRNLTLLLQEVAENPTGYNFYNLGKQYKANNEYAKALEAYQKAFQDSKNRIFIVALLVDLVDCLRYLKRYEEATRVAIDAIHSFTTYTDLHFALGLVYAEMEYMRDAEICFHTCLELGEVTVTETFEGVGSYYAQLNLGEIASKEHRNMDAFEAAIQVLQMKKNYVPALELYLRTVMRTRVPAADVFENMQGIYSLTSAQDVLHLITVLYRLRHPLMNRYIETFGIDVDQTLRAIAYLYGKEYLRARDLFLSLEKIDEDKGTDILLLALLLHDESLLARSKTLFNLGQKNWKVIEKIVRAEELGSNGVPDEVAKVLLMLCKHLIVLQEFVAFDTLSGLLLTCSSNIQRELAELLQTYGYVDGALQILLQLVQREPKQAVLYRMIGDLLMRKQQPLDALSMYVKLIDLRKLDFETFERLYTAYSQIGDQQSLQTIVQELKQRFPLSIWAQQL